MPVPTCRNLRFRHVLNPAGWSCFERARAQPAVVPQPPPLLLDVEMGVYLSCFIVPTHPPTSQNHFPCHVTKGDSWYAWIGDHGYNPVTAEKRPTSNPVDRFSGCGGKRLTPCQTSFPPREELPPSGPPRSADHPAGSTPHTPFTRVTRVPMGS